MTAAAFIHPTSEVLTEHVGKATRIWQFCVVLKGAVIGKDCNICAHVFVENDVIVGDRVTVKNGVQLWDGIRVEDDVFIGPNASFCNDKWPRSRVQMPVPQFTTLRRGCSIGSGAVVLPGLEIGEGAMVAAGAVVTMTVPPQSVVAGNPARVIARVTDHAQHFTARS